MHNLTGHLERDENTVLSSQGPHILPLTMEQSVMNSKTRPRGEQRRKSQKIVFGFCWQKAWRVEPSCLSPTVTPVGSFQKGSQRLPKH